MNTHEYNMNKKYKNPHLYGSDQNDWWYVNPGLIKISPKYVKLTQWYEYIVILFTLRTYVSKVL